MVDHISDHLGVINIHKFRGQFSDLAVHGNVHAACRRSQSNDSGFNTDGDGSQEVTPTGGTTVHSRPAFYGHKRSHSDSHSHLQRLTSPLLNHAPSHKPSHSAPPCPLMADRVNGLSEETINSIAAITAGSASLDCLQQDPPTQVADPCTQGEASAKGESLPIDSRIINSPTRHLDPAHCDLSLNLSGPLSDDSTFLAELQPPEAELTPMEVELAPSTRHKLPLSKAHYAKRTKHKGKGGHNGSSKQSSWLLRLFESKLFDMSIAIQYLFHSKEPGVQSYIGGFILLSPHDLGIYCTICMSDSLALESVLTLIIFSLLSN